MSCIFPLQRFLDPGWDLICRPAVLPQHIRRLAGLTELVVDADLPELAADLTHQHIGYRIAQTAVTKLYGKESLITPAPLMGSEDFSWFGKDGIPYIYGFVASHNKDWDFRYGNHHEKYDVDETILHRGAAVAAQFAADYLAETAQQ